MSLAPPLDASNDPARTSWVASANDGATDFPLQNLPIASFRCRGQTTPYRGGIAIGDRILDLAQVQGTGVLTGNAAIAAQAAALPTLNELMRLGPVSQSALRRAVFDGLASDSPARRQFEPCLVAHAAAEFRTPADIGDYSDFYASIHHATAVGRLFRPDKPLLPNYRWVPVGYHGRSSSIGVSGQAFHRPRGQILPAGEAQPRLAATARLDYEVELGVFIGHENALGEPISTSAAETHVFGLCLLNDWSARDVQTWEYQPLGPFLAKNFATTISPWIVSLQALAPFRVPFTRAAAEPQPLPYLTSPANSAWGSIDIRLEAWIETAHMRERGDAPVKLSASSFRHSFWTVAQLIAHHSVNGCNLRAGDLLGTGTQSGPGAHEAGSLLELTSGGTSAVRVGATEERTFLDDGDRVILRGFCERPGAVRLGFGEASGLVLAAR